MNPASVWHRSRMRSPSRATRSRSRSASLRALSARISASVGKRTEDLFKASEFIVSELAQVVGADRAAVLVVLDVEPGRLAARHLGGDGRAELPLLGRGIPEPLEVPE